jgi:hypothetical protein
VFGSLTNAKGPASRDPAKRDLWSKATRHDAPLGAILLHGNDHVVEFNEIHDVCLQADDMGVFYMGRDPSEQGNIFLNNFIHHTGNSYCLVFLIVDYQKNKNMAAMTTSSATTSS